MNLKLKQGVKGEVANEGMGTSIYKKFKLKYLTHKIVTKKYTKNFTFSFKNQNL